MHLVWVLVFLLEFRFIKQQDIRSDFISDACSSLPDKGTCSDCIQINPNCAWCKEFYNSNVENTQCDSYEKLQKTCKSIENPESQHKENILELRVNQELKFTIPYKQPENYPVDLYMLVDAANGMRDFSKQVKDLSPKIVQSLEKLTAGDFKIGFGTFSDKSLVPTVRMNRDFTVLTRENYEEPPHIFHNIVPLTKDVNLFQESIANVTITNQLDFPNCGFSAAMQALLCEEEINWRKGARKILLIATNHFSHLEGDGHLLGLYNRYEDHCLMKNRQKLIYDHQDYPSIEQIRTKTLEKEVTILFVVRNFKDPQGEDQDAGVSLAMDTIIREYNNFAKKIGGSTKTAKLLDDSSNVVEIIKKYYKEISGEVEISWKDQQNSGNLEVKLEAECEPGKLTDDHICRKVQAGTTVKFHISVKLKSCNETNERNMKLAIGVENKEFYLKELCDCDCEKNVKKGADICNGKGTQICGKCTCNDGFTGENCQCDKKIQGHNATKCDDRTCNYRGKCQCDGTCRCFEGYHGPDCSCKDNEGCKFYNNEVCGGKSRGYCFCKNCTCLNEYEGDNCGCLKSNSTCKTDNNLICNDKGVCECGKCICEKDYFGSTCEKCLTCEKHCDDSFDCVVCKAFSNHTRFTPDECKRNCEHVTVVDYKVGGQEYVTQLCVRSLPNKCRIFYSYYHATGKLKVWNKTKCIESSRKTMFIVIGVIVGIVLVGIFIVLAWRIAVAIKDRREFTQFEKNMDSAQYETADNPLYKPAIKTFENPMYNS